MDEENIFRTLSLKYKSSRGDYKPYFKYIKKQFGNNIITADIGVWSGWNSYKILEELKPKKHYMVDPYIFYDAYTSKSKFGTWNKVIESEEQTIVTNEDIGNVYEEVSEAFKIYPNIVFIRDFAETYIKTLPDNHIHLTVLEMNPRQDVRDIIFDETFRATKKDGFMCIFPSMPPNYNQTKNFEEKHEGEYEKYTFWKAINEFEDAGLESLMDLRKITREDKHKIYYFGRYIMGIRTMGYKKL